MIDAFWMQPEPGPQHRQLLDLVEAAHRASAVRENGSSVAASLAFNGSGSYVQAIAGALMTLGRAHGPIPQTVVLLYHPDPAAVAGEMLASGQRVPGWGSSFNKGQHDPLWREVRTWFANHSPSLTRKVLGVTALLHAAGKRVMPNPSCWTACAAIELGLPAPFSPYLFLASRLPVWTSQLMESADV